MKREPWAIGNTFGYAIRVLNSIFCRKGDIRGWSEEDKEMGEDNKWLVAEQINSMCSDMMIEDAQDILKMISSMPSNRLCEEITCVYHHPDNPGSHGYNGLYNKRCGECCHNKNQTDATLNHFKRKRISGD